MLLRKEGCCGCLLDNEQDTDGVARWTCKSSSVGRHSVLDSISCRRRRPSTPRLCWPTQRSCRWADGSWGDIVSRAIEAGLQQSQSCLLTPRSCTWGSSVVLGFQMVAPGQCLQSRVCTVFIKCIYRSFLLLTGHAVQRDARPHPGGRPERAHQVTQCGCAGGVPGTARPSRIAVWNAQAACAWRLVYFAARTHLISSPSPSQVQALFLLHSHAGGRSVRGALPAGAAARRPAAQRSRCDG